MHNDACNRYLQSHSRQSLTRLTWTDSFLELESSLRCEDAIGFGDGSNIAPDGPCGKTIALASIEQGHPRHRRPASRFARARCGRCTAAQDITRSARITRFEQKRLSPDLPPKKENVMKTQPFSPACLFQNQTSSEQVRSSSMSTRKRVTITIVTLAVCSLGCRVDVEQALRLTSGAR